MIPARSDHLAAMAQYPAVRSRLLGPTRVERQVLAAIEARRLAEQRRHLIQVRWDMRRALRAQRIALQRQRDEARIAEENLLIERRLSTRREQIRNLVRDICTLHGVTLNDIVGPFREARIVRARNEAIYQIRHTFTLSLPQIGRIFHRDHTTIMHSIRKEEARRAALGGGE